MSAGRLISTKVVVFSRRAPGDPSESTIS